MNKKELQLKFLQAMTDVFKQYSGIDVIKVFKGSEHLIYCYYTNDSSEPYTCKQVWADKFNDDEQYEAHDAICSAIENVCKDTKLLKYCHLSNKASGIRFRLDYDNGDSSTSREKAKALLMTKLAANTATLKAALRYNDETKKGERKMNDFSLTNLKDALINKVTHLDRKTVMVLAILALLLLIAGKYQTIKDIAIGIKDKVKRSKNFKAMVEDGTNAVNALKKILGIKGGNTDEA